MQEKGGSGEKRKERKTQTKEEEQKKRKRTVLITKENDCCANSGLSITRESESFYYTKVNLVLYTHALQIILFGPFTCEPNIGLGRYKSCPDITLITSSKKRDWREFFLLAIQLQRFFLHTNAHHVTK